ncbi:class I SAM-dependent methyltransferase [Dyella caseinilytica]|uniref:Methyltransferase domain-containing protein n=1 Tax=Dyella caseinilytica TaxID=1849581 RepID=A0ABX7GZR2_9GAMM|nr:methyltransferase domain-containing protein [Dyella caseinilytica]QRN55441.1 methyltransferase domain-containing protein [Dyella caseinilytica]GGA01742.1 methyltransferase [Dyella caseinilytica]
MTYRHQSPENEVLQSWHHNAAAWAQTVRGGHIESRRLVTDHAIVNAICDAQPRSVLDIGCGEGWLVRALASQGIRAMGVDAVPALIAQARDAGGEFQLASYEEIATGCLQLKADTLVCNFALLGKESVEQLLTSLPGLLEEGGRLIVQTVHPLAACGEQAYMDGWRTEEWTGFGSTFPSPAPWYFRTLASWVALFAHTGWRLCEMREPLHPVTSKPASVIFIVQNA